jgi:hypothetical protein
LKANRKIVVTEAVLGAYQKKQNKAIQQNMLLVV